MAAAPEAATEAPIATLSQRLLAFLLDGLVIGFPLGAITALLNPQPGSVADTILGLSIYGIFFLYHGVLNATVGFTPGKWIAGVRVIDTEGHKLGFGKSFLRAFGYFLSAIPLGLGFLWAVRNPERRTWHDKLAGTRVVSVRHYSKPVRWALSTAAWLLLLGAAAGTFYRSVGAPALQDQENIAAAHQTLEALARLEDRHHARTGVYTDSLLSLAADAEDPGGLLRALPKAIAADTLTLQAYAQGYKLSAHALDSGATSVQLQGPAAATP
jgi:uncharacterized RDD family membrane protein YckC